MKCSNCGHQFKANWQVNCSPGGQEAPGLFLLIGAVFFVVGLILDFGWDSNWCWAFYPIAAFVWLQCWVAYGDCEQVYCPECKHPARIFPWSF